MEYWLVYDDASGEELWRGSGPAGSAAAQELPETARLVAVPQSVIASPTLDLAALRTAMKNGIDSVAELVRQQFLTPGAGQALTYQRKEAEARGWAADNGAETPFLTAESTARGMALAALAAEVIAMADAWTVIGSRIEALRMGAKKAIEDATTLGAIVAAARVDWTTVSAG